LLRTTAIGSLLKRSQREFRTFQNQPFQRSRPVEAQLHRFFGTTAGRKAHYGTALVLGLELSAAPRPLAALLAVVAQAA
jgi:hypothetical protein